YKMARNGKEVNIKPKELVIDEIELLSFDMPTIVIRVVCSKGTYIRALARDIGEALGSGGHLTALRRTRVGSVCVEDCHSVDDLTKILENEQIINPEEL
ncbi:tRNA pseudouridine synthase b, partial [gut metagenome]